MAVAETSNRFDPSERNRTNTGVRSRPRNPAAPLSDGLTFIRQERRRQLGPLRICCCPAGARAELYFVAHGRPSLVAKVWVLACSRLLTLSTTVEAANVSEGDESYDAVSDAEPPRDRTPSGRQAVPRRHLVCQPRRDA